MPLLVPGIAGASGGDQLSLTRLELSTVQSINALRVAQGVAPLTVSRALFASASWHCEQMVDGGYFSHVASDGASFASRLEAFYPPGGHSFYSVGENLLWTPRPMDAAAMIADWMKSLEHRRNLLNPIWRQIAVAAVTVSSAPGVFRDKPVTVVTVDFGVRR